jgi:hypothetical protein
MVCAVCAIGDLPVRRFGLFQAKQAPLSLAINFHTIPGYSGLWDTKIASLGLSGNGKSR